MLVMAHREKKQHCECKGKSGQQVDKGFRAPDHRLMAKIGSI